MTDQKKENFISQNDANREGESNPTSVKRAPAFWGEIKKHLEKIEKRPIKYHRLLAEAILKGDFLKIQRIILPNSDVPLSNSSGSFFSQYKGLEFLETNYKDLLPHPIELAIKLCSTDEIDSANTLITHPNRYKVLFIMGANFQKLNKVLAHYQLPQESLENIIDFAFSENKQKALDSFLMGLENSPELYQAAQQILKNKADSIEADSTPPVLQF